MTPMDTDTYSAVTLGIDLLKVIAPILATAACTYVVWALQQVRVEKTKAESAARESKASAEKSYTAMEGAMVLLLKQHLYTIHRRAKRDGHITYTDRTNFQEIYNIYNHLGGNGVATQMMAEVSTIELRED